MEWFGGTIYNPSVDIHSSVERERGDESDGIGHGASQAQTYRSARRDDVCRRAAGHSFAGMSAR